MHEFSLAYNILEIAQESIQKAGKSKICEICLEIGSLSGVENYALDSALEALAPGSILEGATISKEIVTAKALCCACKESFEPKDHFSPCPSCSSFDKEIIQGKEFRVKSIIAE